MRSFSWIRAAFVAWGLCLFGGCGGPGASSGDGGLPDAGVAGDGGGPSGDGGSAVAECPVPSLIDLYPGPFPPNPYAAGPSAPACVLGEHDVVIVLGCPTGDDGQPSDCQRKRADLAVGLGQLGYGNRFIVTGAAVQNAYVEADTLRDLLLARGVPADRIYREPLAEHTDENLYYSARIMEAHGWRSALVVSDDAGHLVMTAVCDADCCVKLGRLTVFEINFPSPSPPSKVGHYVLAPPASPVSQTECDHIQQPLKLLCVNLASRRACAGNLQLP